MRLVVDTNILISALIKNSLTRKIITGIGYEFFVPSFALDEISKYKNYICEKANITSLIFEEILEILFDNVEIVSIDFYREYLKKSEKLISDKEDVAFLALSFALDCALWSDDKHFDEQDEIKIFKTKDLAKLFLR